MNPYVQYMYSYPHKTAYRPLTGVPLQEYAHFLRGSGHGLYLHIPFCQEKCGYCNLFSVTGQDGDAVGRYFDALKRQSVQYGKLLSAVDAQFSELVVGGGTPLYLSERQLAQMFGMLQAYFRFSPQRSVTIETAPNQTNASKIAVLKQAGVTRVSMGIQSFQDGELRALGRKHCARQARDALHLLKDADFACVNVDFIYGIPGQTCGSLLASLKEALAFFPDEIFLYPLYVRHGVGLQAAGTIPDAGQAFLQYETASRFLKGAGYRQDSMRRFVRQANARAYRACGFGSSLALGCGGRSYLGNLHFCSPYAVDQKECLARLLEYENTVDFTDITHGFLLSDDELKRRYIIRHLFIAPGLSLDHYQETFGSHAMDEFPVLKSWVDQGFAQCSGYLALTETGLALSDYLGPQLISPQVKAAMEEWEATHRQG